MRRFPKFRLSVAGLVLGLIAVLATVSVSIGAAASPGKSYSAVITPRTVPGATQGTFMYTVKDLDAQQALGSFRITIPSPAWNISSASIPAGWTITPGWNQLGYIEARANSNATRLGSNQSITVTFTVDSVPCGGGVFQSQAHQSNLFQGPNNEFAQTNPDSERTVTTSNTPDHFTISTAPISPAIGYKAGQAFNVTVTAVDANGQTVTCYSGQHGALSGLGISPSGKKPLPAGIETTAGVPVTFTNGVSSSPTTVTTYLAGTTQSLAYKLDNGTTAASTSSLTVAPDTFVLAFTTQPGPALQAPATIPGTTAGSSPTVHVADQYGNLAPDGTAVAMSAATFPGGVATALGGSSGAVSGGAGDATFSALSIAALGTYKLTASMPTSPGPPTPLASSPFQIVSTLSNCSGKSSCDQVLSNGNGTGYGKINTNGLFGNVVLTETLLPSTASKCASFTPIPSSNVTDLSVFGDVAASTPSFSVVIITPKSVLQADGFTQRSAASFDLCVGVKRLDGVNPKLGWKTKNGTPGPSDPDADGFSWGIAPDCTQANLVAGSGNPCVRLKTKQLSELLAYFGGTLPAGVTFQNSDLAEALEMGYPFDVRTSGGG